MIFEINPKEKSGTDNIRKGIKHCKVVISMAPTHFKINSTSEIATT